MSAKTDSLFVITPGFAADESDSSCLPLQQALILKLKTAHPDIQIHVFTLHYPFREEIYNWHDIPVHSFHGKNHGAPYRFLLWRKLYKKLKGVSAQTNLKGVLSFWCGEAALFAKKFSIKKSVPHYCWVLGQDARKNSFLKKIKPRAEELVALSDFIQQEFERNHHIKPAHIIEPGINISLFQSVSLPREIDIIGAGSLISLKQYDLFIDTVTQLLGRNPALKTVIVGDGPEKEHLSVRIQKEKLQDHIQLTGALQYTEVLKLMQRAKIFLHPSSYEGYGMVCAEALYAGCKVISFCKPMEKNIMNWHHVDSPEEMIRLTCELLNGQTILETVLTRPISQTAAEFSSLFHL
jgi:glycosyltransferase involved in cell wall biosynthesis